MGGEKRSNTLSKVFNICSSSDKKIRIKVCSPLTVITHRKKKEKKKTKNMTKVKNTINDTIF